MICLVMMVEEDQRQESHTIAAMTGQPLHQHPHHPKMMMAVEEEEESNAF